MANPPSYPGGITARQLAADRANLVKARAVAATNRGASKSKTTGLPKNAVKDFGVKAATGQIARSIHSAPLTTSGMASKLFSIEKHAAVDASAHGPKSPLGTHRVSNSLQVFSHIRKPTGMRPIFRRELSPGSSSRTGWHTARVHHMRKHLRLRHARTKRVALWRKYRGRLTPR